jgi:uncharacterized protein YfaS (alpha-2-macroglobulin family)
MAMILEAITRMGRLQQGNELLKAISKRLTNVRWLSTQTTGYCLLAASKYLKKLGAQQESPLHISYNTGQGTQSVTTQQTMLQRSLQIKGHQQGRVSLQNKSDEPLFARLVLRGKPARSQESTASNGIHVETNYKLTDGTTIDPGRIEQGTDFIAEVKVHHTGVGDDYKEIALSHIIPSGWEIHGMRLNDVEWVEQSTYEYQDVRDDRIYTYFDLDRNETKTFTILLNASYLGSYYMPGISAEAMYDATINGRTAGQEVHVVPPGTLVN